MRVLFMASGDIALPAFHWLIDSPNYEVVAVVTQPDKPVGRHQILTASPIKKLASSAGIRVLQPAKVREPVVLETLAAFSPDFIIVMAYGQILPKTLLSLPRIACLNLHASLLPRHRGASPIQSAILGGDSRTGITLMHMDVGLDTGDMVFHQEIPIQPDETGGTLHDRLARLAALALENGLEQITSGHAPRTPQDPSSATLCTKLDRNSGRIDWQESALQIERQIRAMNPWPGAFTLLPNGKKLKIHRGQIVSATGKPGEILSATPSNWLIAAGEDAIQLQEIQVEGKSRMSAADFLRGHLLTVGEILPFRA